MNATAPKSRPTSTAARTVRIRVKRCDGPGKPQRWETFAVAVERGANIISCLQSIATDPVTVEGARTTLKRVRAWVPIDGTYHLGAGPKESPDRQQQRYKLSECMSCGCCLEACPQFTLKPDDEAEWDLSFIGAHAISQARFFNDHPTGAQLKRERLDALMGPGGVSDCGNAQNCVKVCPKHIPLTESIAIIGRAVTIHAVAKWVRA